MAYNPDALYSQPVGAPSTLPTVALTRMNEPGHAPQRDRCAAALQQLLQHLAGIPAGYNDHNLGHYGIAASNAEYLAKSNQRPHVPPANPGPGPTLLANETTDQRDRKFRQYYIDRAHYDQYKTTEAWAKQLLLNAIDDEYLAHLKDDVLGYQPVSIRSIRRNLMSRIAVGWNSSRVY